MHEDYVEYLMGLRLGERTISIYVNHVGHADRWMTLHHTSLKWAGPREIAEFVTARVPASNSSRSQVAAAFGHYWDWTQRTNPPTRAIRIPPAPEMVCRAIEPDQARDVIKTAVGWWPKGTMVLFGLYLALRRFEIAKAEWSRFDDDMEWYRVTGKYDKTSTLPVHEGLRSELETRRNGSRWVFPGRFPGSHVNPATVGTWVGEVGRAAGIPNLEPHELRHTSLATANDNTGDLRAVQTFARHSKPGTTSGYTRTTATRLREISDALDYL